MNSMGQIQTPMLDLHRAAHGEIGEYFGTLLPARFGDFAAEYKAARETVALADANFMAIFSFTGADRQRLVNAVLTSNVRDLVAGQGNMGLLLTPQGHILAEIETYLAETRILTLSHAMVRERTYATFDKFIIMDDVTLKDLTDQTGILTLVGPLAGRTISQLSGLNIDGLPEFEHAEATIAGFACRVIHRTFVGQPGATIIAAQENLPDLWETLARAVHAQRGTIAGMGAVNALRLERGIPWFGHDFDDTNIPHEAGLQDSHINYEKGCYTGQEIVERVRSRGHVNRRLTLLQFEGESLPAPGTRLVAANDSTATEVGHVTSAAISPLLGRGIGMGYLRRESANVGTRVFAESIPVEVIAVPVAKKIGA
jgi:folate-binding protein YgfZ